MRDGFIALERDYKETVALYSDREARNKVMERICERRVRVKYTHEYGASFYALVSDYRIWESCEGKTLEDPCFRVYRLADDGSMECIKRWDRYVGISEFLRFLRELNGN